MKLALKLTVVLMLIGFIAGASCQQNVVTPDQMTPKGKAAFVLQLYNNADSNYRAQFAATPKPISADMKEYFRTYKTVLENSSPFIDLYVTTVNGNGTPTPAQEQQLLTIIYKLQTLLIKKGD
jgi:hypothetical protein